MSGADRHVGDTDFIFHLANHDAYIAGILGHPMQNARCRTHRIGAVELATRRRAAHRQRLIARQTAKGFSPVGTGSGKAAKFAAA